MRAAFATGIGLWATLGTLAFAATADDLIAYANCLGQSDGYGRDAAQYGFDAEANTAANDARLNRLLTAAQSPGEEALTEARRAGEKAWDARTRALEAQGGTMSGTAWDDHVAASVACVAVSRQLRDEGLID